MGGWGRDTLPLSQKPSRLASTKHEAQDIRRRTARCDLFIPAGIRGVSEGVGNIALLASVPRSVMDGVEGAWDGDGPSGGRAGLRADLGHRRFITLSGERYA